ncbi:MAG: PP2C family protein-serine/threonine phosphatase [Pseudonocardiaceae bacterium]
MVGLLLAVVTVAGIAVGQPSYGIAFYAVIPVVLAAFLWGRLGSLVTAGVASVTYLVVALITGSETLSGSQLLVPVIDRSGIYFIAAVTVPMLLDRERRLRNRLARQEKQLDELKSIRQALTPAEVPARPGLEIATSFIPARGPVAGDFFLVAGGPAGHTTIVVGDVAGHGFEAARRAAYARALVATFAPFTSDPARLLQLTNTALTEQPDPEDGFVTAVCVTVDVHSARLRWACAGHAPPWMLSSGEAIAGGRHSIPLGLVSHDLGLEAGSLTLEPGAGFLLFTDGLIEGRPALRDDATPLRLFGEERVRDILATCRDEPVTVLAEALSTSLHDFTGGSLADDMCMVIFRIAESTELVVSDARYENSHERESQNWSQARVR